MIQAYKGGLALCRATGVRKIGRSRCVKLRLTRITIDEAS